MKKDQKKVSRTNVLSYRRNSNSFNFRFNIASDSEANITTSCEMEFFNFLWHPNLDPIMGVPMGVKGVYRSMWELRVGSGRR